MLGMLLKRDCYPLNPIKGFEFKIDIFLSPPEESPHMQVQAKFTIRHPKSHQYLHIVASFKSCTLVKKPLRADNRIKSY
jgi:hypothetical protein